MYKKNNFQTPEWVCQYMADEMSKLNPFTLNVLEPTPGSGNLVDVLQKKMWDVSTPIEFFSFYHQCKIDDRKFHGIVMNPPFTPMKLGYDILFKCMELSHYIVALMPWLTIINSERRLDELKRWGLKSITHLPRSVFPGSRVQTCILQLSKDYNGKILFEIIKKNKEYYYEAI